MSSQADSRSGTTVWRIPIVMWSLIGILSIIMVIIYYSGLERMVFRWNDSEEYGYGYMIPALTVFFIWLRKNELEKQPFNGSILGTLAVLVGVCIYILGELSTIFVIIQYSFLLTLYGLVLALSGWKAFRIMLVPLLLLVFMVPLPIFLYQGLSAQLQLISSEFGVWLIRLFGISVYLEGNVIDLGSYKLQVVEACSGLRYLFPLAALSFIAAYMYKAALWKRVVIFLSSIPITIFMNSFRIGFIGILVDKWGISQAEGFLHYFEGWIIFMSCMVILVIEMWVLTKIGSNNRSLGESFAIDFPEPTTLDASVLTRKTPITLIISGFLLVVAMATSTILGEREEIYQQRSTFDGFPMVINRWKGNADRIEPIYLDVLKLDDYVMADYQNDEGEQVNFYIAYYASQSKGESAHSPRSCIPGGGWQIQDLSQISLDSALVDDVPITVNRLIIAKGDSKQVVYYWFQGRNRIITNEYMVKWFLFWDALTKNRTDGALVRLTAFIAPGEDIAEADRRLTSFTREVSGVLADYIPD